MHDVQACLVVIDAQRGYDDRVWGKRHNIAADWEIGRLLQAWRRSGRPVVHVHHYSNVPGSPFAPDAEGCAPVLQAEPHAGESVYLRSAPSAFLGTTLERDLRARGVQSVVLTGLTSDGAVADTARAAARLGFSVTVVSDATGTFAREEPDGMVRPGREIHEAALASLADIAVVLNTDAVLANLHASLPGKPHR